MSFRRPLKKATQRPDRHTRARLKEAEVVEAKECEKRISDEAPPTGTNPLAKDVIHTSNKSNDKTKSTTAATEPATSVTYSAIRNFDELPISNRSKTSLKAGGFVRMTDIQRAAIPHALAGRDILGAARTGSGKTIAFLLPLVERLWRLGWSRSDGVGAIVISPTRELALQIFDVLRTIGQSHDLSAGLVIGGKSVEEEQARINTMAIIVCTPGRLLQHMEQTYGFDASNLQLLVLDEADRILDMGFSATLNAILDNLPSERQTMLFSATQTKSVRDLARLSLKNPEYLAVHANDVLSTPDKLSQHFMLAPAHQKLDLTFSFIKTHLKSKTLMFLSSCKQVRFVYEQFRRMRPGVPLLHLHGQMSQQRRMAIYYDFCSKKEVVMFCTDIAARGLDFPDVDWVVQIDAPDTVQTYIHRVGRTARYRAGGNALIMVDPSESGLIDKIREAKVSFVKVKVNPSQLRGIRSTFQAAMIENNELKQLGQKALISYLKAIHLRSDKAIFDVSRLDIPALADSMGLPSAPSVKLGAGKVSVEKSKNLPYALKDLMEGKIKKRSDDRGMAEHDKLLKRTNPSKAIAPISAEESDGDDDILIPKSRGAHSLSDSEDEAASDSTFGQSFDASAGFRISHDVSASMHETRDWLSTVGAELAAEDVDDKAREHERVHAIHQKRRRKEKILNLKKRPVPQADEEDEDSAPRLATPPASDNDDEDDGEAPALVEWNEADNDGQAADGADDSGDNDDVAAGAGADDAFEVDLNESDGDIESAITALPQSKSTMPALTSKRVREEASDGVLKPIRASNKRPRLPR